MIITRRVDITPSEDDGTLQEPTQGLWIGSGGNVVVRQSGQRVTIRNVQDGTLLPDSVTHVYAIGTTASNIQLVYAV